MDLGIDGKVALVTGASSGLGLGIAAALAGEGVKVAISSRTEERINAAAEQIGATAFVHDNNATGDVPKLVEAVEAALGPIDILITNTGGPPPVQPLEAPEAQWETGYRELVLAPMALVRATVPGMRERGFGRVVSVAASGVREPVPALILSNAHRISLLAAFKMLAREVAADGVTLNSVLPGLIGTDRLLTLFGSRENAEGMAQAQIPAKRLGTVEEVASVAAFLCSARASYVTGTAVLIDGGFTHGV